MNHFALTIVGRDRPGIVSQVTKILFDQGCNLADSASREKDAKRQIGIRLLNVVSQYLYGESDAGKGTSGLDEATDTFPFTQGRKAHSCLEDY